MQSFSRSTARHFSKVEEVVAPLLVIALVLATWEVTVSLASYNAAAMQTNSVGHLISPYGEVATKTFKITTMALDWVSSNGSCIASPNGTRVKLFPARKRYPRAAQLLVHRRRLLKHLVSAEPATGPYLLVNCALNAKDQKWNCWTSLCRLRRAWLPVDARDSSLGASH